MHKGKKGKDVPVYAIKAYGGAEVQLHFFLSLELAGGEWHLLHTPATLCPGKEHLAATEREAGWPSELVCFDTE